jgi:hypothetical protein
MAFCGWPSSALTFFSGLEADNTKTYWLTHRETYDKAVRAPMDLLLESLLDEFGPGKVFRPYGCAGPGLWLEPGSRAQPPPSGCIWPQPRRSLSSGIAPPAGKAAGPGRTVLRTLPETPLCPSSRVMTGCRRPNAPQSHGS